MKALVCPNEPVPNGYRIAQVEPDDKIFGVAEPMYWMNCADEVVADFWYFDPSDRTIKEVPRPVFASANNQPVSSGAQVI